MCTVLLPPGLNPISVNKYININPQFTPLWYICSCIRRSGPVSRDMTKAPSKDKVPNCLVAPCLTEKVGTSIVNRHNVCLQNVRFWTYSHITYIRTAPSGFTRVTTYTRSLSEHQFDLPIWKPYIIYPHKRLLCPWAGSAGHAEEVSQSMGRVCCL
jgi:hypothetical protein